MTDRYETPLAGRYASREMTELFSADSRYRTWRRLWTELARAEMELGLPIEERQVRELEEHIDDIDYDAVRDREKEVRHDVMAHIYAYGKAAPSAEPIIHLGATSCYVTDNTDLILYRNALGLVRAELVRVLKVLAGFAQKYSALPTLGYTHYQPAQLVTVGKRATLWMQDLLMDLQELDQAADSIRFLGCRGATGTEASFMKLFDGSSEKIDEMNRRIASRFGFDSCFDVSGQTYPRKLDSRILNCLSSIGQSCYRFASDIRLLQHDHQIEEPFGSNQVGSSAMAYKQNPMRCERICSLSRYLMVDSLNASLTASSQWFERTLDDSANRRISLPEGFLCADAVLRLTANVAQGLRVNEAVIRRDVEKNLPFIATEDIIMEGVRRGGDRQKLHEAIRQASVQAASLEKMGESADLAAALAADDSIGMSESEIRAMLDPAMYIGRCPEQVASFLNKIKPVIQDADDAAVVIEV